MRNILVLLSFLLISASYSTPSSSTPVNTPPPSIPKLSPPLGKPKAKPSNLIIVPKRGLKEVQTAVHQQQFYFHPGTIFFRDDKWHGVDNLLNLPKNFEIQVNIIKSDDITISIDNAFLEGKVQAIFSEAGFSKELSISKISPPLPFFNIVVMIFKYKDGYAAGITSRLFESVQLKRIQIESGGVFQAITWEKTGLIVAKKEEFDNLLSATIMGIVTEFVQRLTSHTVETP